MSFWACLAFRESHLGEKWEEDSGALLHGLDPALVLT